MFDYVCVSVFMLNWNETGKKNTSMDLAITKNECLLWKADIYRRWYRSFIILDFFKNDDDDDDNHHV